MLIEIYSDIACPWCYIGKARFEKALAQYPHADAVTVVWRSFELDAEAPRSDPPLSSDNLMVKYRQSREGVAEMMARVSEQAAAEGLEFKLDIARNANTFDAHRLVHAAAALEPDAPGAKLVMERLMRAQQCEGEDLTDHDTLTRLAVETGMDAELAARVLGSDDYADPVRADEERASRFGIGGVPYFVIDEKHGISGAQPTELFLRALEQLGPHTTPA